jgi:hypothetical protein
MILLRRDEPSQRAGDCSGHEHDSRESYSQCKWRICLRRIPTAATVREGQGINAAQTRLLCRFAWANSRRICVGHNCASNDPLMQRSDGFDGWICRDFAEDWILALADVSGYRA